MEVVNSDTRNTRHAQNTMNKQFSPRIGLTYQPFQNTVFSGGYGLLWIPQDVSFEASPNNDPINAFTTPYTATIDSGFTPAHTLDNPLPGGILSAPGRNGFQPILLGTAVNSVFPNNPYAYAQQWNFGVQQQIGSSLVFDIAYAAAKGTHLPFYELPVNSLPDSDLGLGVTALQKQVANPFLGIINPNYALGAATLPASQLLSKYPQYSQVNIAAAGQAGSTYNALQVKAQKRFSGGAQISLGYAWAKLMSNSDTQTAWLESSVAGAYGSFVDPNRPSLERSLSSNDVKHRLTIVYVYDLPVGRHKALLGNASRPVDAVVGRLGTGRVDDAAVWLPAWLWSQ